MKASILLAVMGIIGGVPVAAHAAIPGVVDGSESGFYMGGAVGQSRLKVSSSEFDGSATLKETGFKVFGGYQLNPYFSLEAGYYNPGKFSESGGGANLTLDVDVLQVSAIGTFPIAGGVEGFGRIGVSRWDADLTGSLDGETETLEDSSTDFTFGIGIQARLTDNLTIGAQVEQTEVEQDVEDVDVDWELRFFSVFARYRF
jgi:OOP family OmpA-OmpF porin